MDDLSKWDLTDEFSHEEISALIIGVDPVTVSDPKSLRPSIDVVENAYLNAVGFFRFGLEVEGKAEGPSNTTLSLYSQSLLRLPNYKGPPGAYPIEVYDRILKDEKTTIELQIFTRKEISRWLNANEIKSKYVFNKTKSNEEKKQSLNSKERTSLYKLIIGMAIDGYRYRPEDRKSSIPKEITDNLATHGIEIDTDTVRKYLKASAEDVLPKIKNS